MSARKFAKPLAPRQRSHTVTPRPPQYGHPLLEGRVQEAIIASHEWCVGDFEPPRQCPWETCSRTIDGLPVLRHRV
jgi:hypothetical protein